MGFFVNTLVLRVQRMKGSVRRCIAQMRKTLMAAIAHGDVPFEKIVDRVNPIRETGRTLLFQVMFAFRNEPTPNLALPQVTSSRWLQHPGVSKFDLSLEMGESGEGLAGHFEYDSDLFDAAAIARMVAHFRNLLVVLTNPDEANLLRLPMLGTAERNHILISFNETRKAYSQPESLQYVDYALWERRWLRGELPQKQLSFWPQQLARAFPALLCDSKNHGSGI